MFNSLNLKEKKFSSFRFQLMISRVRTNDLLTIHKVNVHINVAFTTKSKQPDYKP